MNKFIFILFALILNLSTERAEVFRCGDEIIANCKECGKGEESNSCAICKAEHFPLLENLLCIPCDDPILGQVGCKGECDSSDYSSSSFAYCQECKEGYYNLEGLCYSCETGSPGCLECKYEKEEELENKRFKCQKCLNEEEYIINENFRCEKCNERLEHCRKCHYKKEGENIQPQCDECYNGYYVDTDYTCKSCYYQDITGGECRICSSDSKPDYCRCYLGYVLDGNTCRNCQSYCDRCEYNSETDSTKCLRCEPGYTLNLENKCVPCEEGCNYCYLDDNNNSICLICNSNKFLPGETKCLICPSGCSECEYDNDKKEAVCIRCNSYHALDPKTNECKYCRNIEETGEGCETCLYNLLSKKYECQTCYTYYSSGYTHYDYAYVKNTFQCLSNTKPEKIGLYGCLTAEYIQSTDSYECLECKNYTDNYFIPVITDNSCIEPLSVGLSNKCLEAEKIGNNYSCSKCVDYYTLVQDISTNIKTCYERVDTLSYCLEGKLENGNLICTKCVNNSALNENICSCNSDSFSKDTKWCYKCDDYKMGTPGCDESKGCEYFQANDQLNCKKCKDGYFGYTEGQCFLCSSIIPNCNKCHYNTTNEKLICDSCINSVYAINTEDNKCELNECEEYPEISPGCIICKDKLNEYKENGKCQRCKYGYFKTKEEKCVYCKSEEYGGPGCFECGYQTDENGIETDNIICKGCYQSYSYFHPNDYYYYYYDYYYDYYIDYYYVYHYYRREFHNSTLLSSKGKCYDCQLQFSGCIQCEFFKNKDETEILKCTACSIGYYLSPEGNCVSFANIDKKVQNCIEYYFWIGDMKFWLYNDYYLEVSYLQYFNLSYYNTYVSDYFSSGEKKIDAKCDYCYNGYYLNGNGNCEQLFYDNCTFNSIMKNYNKLRYACDNFCYNYNNVRITIKLKGKTEKENVDFYIGNFSYSIYNEFIDKFGESNTIKTCLSNSGEGGEYAPENLKYCRMAYYYPENNSYICIECQSGYILSNITNLCFKNTNDSCTVENIGTEIIPVYDCIEWNKRGHNFILVTNENGEKEYVENKGDLIGCVEALANTTYINSKYNCTRCSFMYAPYFSKYFDRIICQNIKAKIIRENSISYDLYEKVKEKVNATNGTCEKNYLFTPDGEFCYKCNDELVGMPGCKGGCNFSLKRNNALKCEGECKNGYIESSEGICSPCSVISKGCHECHYENEYPIDYKGIKRSRRFICDYCEEGYMQSPSGECLDCNDLGLHDCTKCKIDPNNNNNYVCTQCLENYFVNDEGQCETCNSNHFKGINKNKCVECGNILEGGIDNCRFCESDEEKVICNQCFPGYILLTNNNSCLEIINNKELQKFSDCERLTIENNKLVCSKCKSRYSLIKMNDIKECLYIPTLYDEKFRINYENHFYTINKGEVEYNDLSLFKGKDYIYKRYINYYPCQEADNLGTEENPLFSCTKCYEYFGEEEYSVRIKEENSQVSYCINGYSYEELEYCKEATFKIKNGKEVFNCTECYRNYALTFNKYTKTYYCQFTNATTKCLVLYCKTCNPHDGYSCEECLPDYVIDSLTGYCVKKTEVVPAVTWKDIYRLNMNGQKVINNKYIHGPSLIMRGITSSQINTRHAFLIYLTFQIKHRIRNLEDEPIKMPAICEVSEGVDETGDDVNMVEYECIGNQTSNLDLTDYKLDNIEEGNNDNSLKKSNLNELVSEIKSELGDLGNLENVQKSSFTYEDLVKIVIFQMNEKIQKFEANDFNFNFKIEGKLNKDITQNEIIIKKEFELVEVDTKANCIFKIGLNKIADLSCDLNVENHKDIKTFSFKTSQINTDDNEIYLAKFNDIVLINSEEKDDNKKVIIIVSVVCGVVGAALIGVGIFFLVRKLKSVKTNPVNEIKNANNEDNNKNRDQTNNVMVHEGADTGERISRFENK